MHTKTMEGLAGASMNMKLLNTPFRVYKDAERRGDTAVMERAMGYVGEFADKAEDYQKKAEKGMKEDAKEAREKAKTEQGNAIQKRKEESEELEKRIQIPSASAKMGRPHWTRRRIQFRQVQTMAYLSKKQRMLLRWNL